MKFEKRGEVWKVIGEDGEFQELIRYTNRHGKGNWFKPVQIKKGEIVEYGFGGDMPVEHCGGTVSKEIEEAYWEHKKKEMESSVDK